ncbi:hypothetical protein NQ314_013593 [Rhamnusium bicolor]|uniref:Uncharacterized protein n=1 Tax=Rhamnusium bicolor TaxID=1586634 RepID=A0AAV8X6B7_9CUCU|nr:hypothetical protein NQ314_013593 [Rhamnusium bicolor]
MESELLKREDEFYRENEKLEQRTKELMRKVNDVMKIQDNLIKESLKTKTEINSAKINNFKLHSNNHPEYFEPAGDCNKNNENSGIPDGITEMGPKGASHFYRAKIKCLQAENVMLQSENKKKELKESHRKQINDLTSTVKHIEKHKTELLNGFKKQMQLIDNLKKQKMYLEAHKIAELSENEYMKILDLKME